MNTIITLTVIGCTAIAVIGFVGIIVAIRNLDDHMEKRTDEIVKMSDIITYLFRFSDKTAQEKVEIEKELEGVKKATIKPKEVRKTKPPKKVAEKSNQSVSEPPTVYGEKWMPIVYTTPIGNDIADGYLVSNKGRVWIKSAKRFAKMHYSKRNGYVTVALRRADGRQSSYCVKTIVATMFLKPFDLYEYKVVCIDGNELDCSINNLKLEKIVRR